MRPAVVVDVIAIAAGIAIILAIADDRADRGAEDAANCRARTSPDAWKDRTRESTGARSDYRSGCAAGNHMISVWVACAATQRETAGNSGRD